ncbi:MAG: GIY-YIG nuclease family protein [Muribaculaceae bacterium]|nr:GIY-YIG nuclease family protein [Muribaculaceae bacterium]
MGKTITTYLIDGTPQGPRMVYVSNKNCMAIVVPRSKMTEVVCRKELQKYALYILLGETDEGEPKAYIGETNNFSKRIKDHDQKKDFWSKALVFISQNESQIDKADVQYLEAKAISLALKNKQFILNENKQSPDLPVLPEHKRDPDDEFFDDIIFLASFIGCNIFETPDSKLNKHSTHLFLTGRGADAQAVYNENGLTVLAGSIIASDNTATCPSPEKRMKLIAELTEHIEGKRILKLNKRFDSPSAASVFCLGRSSNGWVEWHSAKGIPLKSLINVSST